jgi:hypothetical protein
VDSAKEGFIFGGTMRYSEDDLRNNSTLIHSYENYELWVIDADEPYRDFMFIYNTHEQSAATLNNILGLGRINWFKGDPEAASDFLSKLMMLLAEGGDEVLKEQKKRH